MFSSQVKKQSLQKKKNLNPKPRLIRGFFDLMEEKKEVTPVSQAAFELFQKEVELPEVEVGASEDDYVRILSKAIGMMLNRDFERLLQICYRIDLGEAKLKKILNESDPEMVSSDLARALWDRQKQKIETRRKYS